MTVDLNLSVRLCRDFRAPIDRVFAAWSDPAFFALWWENLKTAELDVREGGRLRLEWHTWDGHVEGVYTKVVANEEIAFTWNAVPAEGEKESTVSIQFEAVDADTTRVRLVHDLNRTQEEHASHQTGWKAALDDLAKTFERAVASIRVERHLMASPEQVYGALTNGPTMNRWFFTRCETDPRVDGQFAIDWESSTEASRNHRRSGRYLAVVPNKHISFEWGGLDLDGSTPTTQVSITLTPTATGTQLVLEHTGWGDDDAWTASRDNHESGWQFYMDNLGRHLHGEPDLRAAFFQQKVTTQPSASA